MCISKAGFSSLRNVWAKYKDKATDVSDTDQNIGTSSKYRLKVTELKDLCNKDAEKLVKEECM